MNVASTTSRPASSGLRRLHAVCIQNGFKKSRHHAFNYLGATNEEQTFQKYVRLQRIRRYEGEVDEFLKLALGRGYCGRMQLLPPSGARNDGRVPQRGASALEPGAA